MISINPRPKFDLSPYLYMQFMEPLGNADPSVEAGWDFARHAWREDFVQAVTELSPTLIRWGGIFCDYYRWKEGVGPRHRRKPMHNLCWKGIQSNQVGTHELVALCRQVGAEPLLTVNFASDGRQHYHRDPFGGLRTAGAKEAAQWVDYCNNPASALRRRHGVKKPLGVKLWQLGNETSYGKVGFDCQTACRKTLEFAQAMHKVDPALELIGWGDLDANKLVWARRMMEVAGEHLKYLAFHPHFNSNLPDSPLVGTQYRKDPALTWHHLMNAYTLTRDKLDVMRQEIRGLDVHLAMTESHFYLYPHNQCDVLRSWAAGVADARVLNVHARNGDILKIATLADFAGNRWTVNAVMIPCPSGKSYLMPVARVMSLYRRHVGKKAVDVRCSNSDLDVTASRTGGKFFLHVVNINRTRSVRTRLAVAGLKLAGGRAFEIADDPQREIDDTCPDIFAPVEKPVPATGDWTFPPASVTAIELKVARLPCDD